MPSRSYYLHQARVCQSLARLTDEPVLRARYDQLALEFSAQSGEADDTEAGGPPDFIPKVKPDSGDATSRGLVIWSFLVGLVLCSIASQADARCFCQCVRGHVEALCETTSDIRPACTPTLCGLSTQNGGSGSTAYSISPNCKSRVLCDKHGRCRRREICE
jgi:hypothetical protein